MFLVMFRIGKQKLKTYVNGVERKVHCLEVHRKTKRAPDSGFISPYPRTTKLSLSGSRHSGHLIIFHNNCVSLCYKNFVSVERKSLEVLGSSCAGFNAARKFTRPIQYKAEVNDETEKTCFHALTPKSFLPPKAKTTYGKGYKISPITGETNSRKATKLTVPLSPIAKTTKTVNCTKVTQQKTKKIASAEIKNNVLFIKKTKTSVKVIMKNNLFSDKKDDPEKVFAQDGLFSNEEIRVDEKLHSAKNVDKSPLRRTKNGAEQSGKMEEAGNISVPEEIKIPSAPPSEMNKDKLHLRVILPKVCSE